MKKVGVGILVLVLVGYGVFYFWPRGLENPFRGIGQKKEYDLEKYDFDNLRKRGGVAAEIQILGNIKEVEQRRKEEYKFTTREIRFKSNDKWISGMINYYPEKSSLSKVIIMIRGYAEKAGYYPGSGSWRVADKLAEAGYATISLDFLGYGHSDEESADPMEARFEKVESVLDLIESVRQLPWVDKNSIGIWAHSNGGQIALTVLEVTGKKYPTVLWAPMTNPFPQSLIDTADPGEDKQKAQEFVDLFLKHYDGRRYAFENYYQWIKAPVLIQQGTGDEWCQLSWQQSVISKLREQGKEAELLIYGGDDHNLSKNWEEAVEKDIEFFLDHLTLSVFIRNLGEKEMERGVDALSRNNDQI